LNHKQIEHFNYVFLHFQETLSPPGIRTTRQRPPTLLDKFVSRSNRRASCDLIPPVQSAKPTTRPSSAGLFFPCSKSRTKPKKQNQREKCVAASTSKAGNSENTFPGNDVVDLQEPSTSAAYNDMQKPGVSKFKETSQSQPSKGVVKLSSKCSSVASPNVSEYLQGVAAVGNDVLEFNAGLVNVEGKLCVVGDGQKLSETISQQTKSFGMPGYDLQKTCANLAEHIFNKSCTGFPGEDFQTLYPNISSPSNPSSLYSPLLIDESKNKDLDSPIPDVMLSSCANMSEISAIKTPSVKEVIVLSSDSEISRENSVVPIISIPVIDISDSSENNTPVPSCSAAGALGDAKHSLRSLSVTVERLPTPSFALMHQTSEEEPCTSAAEKQKRSLSMESCDSISHELVHFKPIQTCPRTPPKRLPNGKAINPAIIVSTPRNLTKQICSSSPLPTMPEASLEGSPLIKRHLQTLAAEHFQQVKVHSKGIETDCNLVPHPLSPFRPQAGFLNCKPHANSLAQASKKLDFDGSGDSGSGISRRHFAQIADLIEQNRVENFTLPEDFNVSEKKNHKLDDILEPVVKQEKKFVHTSNDDAEISKWAENSAENIKKSPGRVYSMRRIKKRVKNSQDCSADRVKKKNLAPESDDKGTPCTIRTIEDWIRSSQDKQNNDLMNMVDTKVKSTCSPPIKRLCTRRVKYENKDASLHHDKIRGNDSKINKHSHSDAVQSGCGSKVLKNNKQSNSQGKLGFSREQRLKSDCESDCSSIGGRVVKNKKIRKTKTRDWKKRKFSELELSSDEHRAKKTSSSSTVDLADEDMDLESMDRRMALQLQEQFNYEAKNQMTMYRLRGGSEEYLFRRRARSATTVNSQAS
jgi:hypothetical protein